jgi:hypothetical protein
MTFIIMQFSPLSGYFCLPRSKYFPGSLFSDALIHILSSVWEIMCIHMYANMCIHMYGNMFRVNLLLAR